MTTIKNSSGNRALVAYCYKDNFTDEERFSFNEEICEILQNIGGLNEKYIIDDPRTVNVALTSDAWARSLKIGNCSGDLIVGVYFYTAPQPFDTRGTMAEVNEFFGEEVEPEPPSITSLVCNALQEAFPDGKVGASSFVINSDLIDFELDVE